MSWTILRYTVQQSFWLVLEIFTRISIQNLRYQPFLNSERRVAPIFTRKKTNKRRKQ